MRRFRRDDEAAPLPPPPQETPLDKGKDYAIRHANTAWAIVHLADVLRVAFEIDGYEELLTKPLEEEE